MSTNSCLICGGTYRTALGEPCPECCKEKPKASPVVAGIPAQYQGVMFDKSFLPQKLQGTYGEFMEELLRTIVNDIAFYQKNMLICCRPNSGKTVWAYSLYAGIIEKGYSCPPLVDIVEVRDILSSYTDKEGSALLSSSRCAIVKLPRDMQFWMFNKLSHILERRVRGGGFTIFLYGGTIEELKVVDRDGCLSWLRGTGAFNTVKVESFS